MNELHFVERQIVELLEKLETAHFNDIKPANIDPKLFVYHLEKLCSAGIIEKTTDGLYQFTQAGKHAMASFHLGVGLYDAHINSYIVIALKYREKYLVITRSRVPFLGYTGFLSMHFDKSEHLLDSARAFLQENVILTRQLREALLLDILYKSRTSSEIVQHSLVFVVTGELESENVPAEIAEGTLQFMTKAELLAVEKGYSNTKDILDYENNQNFAYVNREYDDDL
jgi:hypothetical protein